MNKWIPCKSLNPDARGRYLTYTPKPMYGGDGIEFMNYGTSRKWDNGRNRLLPAENRVTHWMKVSPPDDL